MHKNRHDNQFVTEHKNPTLVEMTLRTLKFNINIINKIRSMMTHDLRTILIQISLIKCPE